MAAFGHWVGIEERRDLSRSFFHGTCHLGAFVLPWDPLEKLPCPFYGREFYTKACLMRFPPIEPTEGGVSVPCFGGGGKRFGLVSVSGLTSLSHY